MARYSMTKTISGSYDEVKTRVQEALKAEGFGILTEIDVQATLESKLGETIERYEILGACNPQLAFQALQAERHIGLLLPCNVVLREVENGVEVSILDPEVMFEVADDEIRQSLAELPGEAQGRLRRSLEALA